MIGTYGQKWIDDYGEVPKGPAAARWLEALGSRTDENRLTSSQLRAANRACLNSPDAFPPRPGKFRKLALENDRPEHRLLPPSARIEVQRSEPEIEQRYMDQIRGLVK